MAKLLKAISSDETVITDVEYTGSEIPLSKLQELVGGYIEIVSLTEGRMLAIHEDAKLTDHFSNHVANILTSGLLMRGDYIAGDAVLLERGELS